MRSRSARYVLSRLNADEADVATTNSTATIRTYSTTLLKANLTHLHSRYDWLALPHDVQEAPNEAVSRT